MLWEIKQEVVTMKKVLSLLLAVSLLLCTVPALAQAKYTVGICQTTQHEALDEATRGFIAGLDAELGAGQVEYRLQNAAGDVNICSAIVNQFVSDGVDLILANATMALQCASAATGDIPILGTAITGYGVALDIEDYDGAVDGNISGTCDLAPLGRQAAMILELFPNTKSVGILYCSAEPNSRYQADTVKAVLETMGIAVTLYPFADSNEMAPVVQQACDASDVIYIPTDNTVASNAGIVDNICRPAGKPVVTGDTGTCRLAGVATLGISYYDLGFATGQMAAKVLTGEANISEMPIAYAPSVIPQYNPEICEALGVSVPDHYIPLSEENASHSQRSL